MDTPLAEILRPKSLDDYIGQKHLVGQGSILRRAIESGNIPSMILWGPPGVGKTTLANIIANTLFCPFYCLSAINSGVKEVREVIEKSRQTKDSILFIDEIHRFSKNQQDSLLGAVEQGVITLIGATTENPSFEVISPLLSRCQVYVLKTFEQDELLEIINKATAFLSKKLNKQIIVSQTEAFIRISTGDARKLLNAVEMVVYQMNDTAKDTITISNEDVTRIIQQNISIYDKKGEMHYDIISAFIKSMRGSDPNAAVYWLSRMIASGEDPLFIARRMLILASEDIGLANPNALLLANVCFDAVNKIGYPECRIILSQTAVYLATSPKSNSTYMAINAALAEVEQSGDLPVPLHLRNAPTKLMKELNYSDGYKYAHDYESNFTPLQFLPSEIQGSIFFQPSNNPKERNLKETLTKQWKDIYNY
ncbi:MAG: replication-associated recombination protein A [Bacteroidales bacterium]|jgi:putative ATPase|nr:replication-associated recombination protein A [Bacteroidales bacterium]